MSRSSHFGWCFEVSEVCVSYRLLQTVLFLTDSVLRVLFAYFDESMGSKIVYNPYRSWNTVGLTPIEIKNKFITVPWSGLLFSFANGAHEFSILSFVLWSFQVLGEFFW